MKKTLLMAAMVAPLALTSGCASVKESIITVQDTHQNMPVDYKATQAEGVYKEYLKAPTTATKHKSFVFGDLTKNAYIGHGTSGEAAEKDGLEKCRKATAAKENKTFATPKDAHCKLNSINGVRTGALHTAKKKTAKGFAAVKKKTKAGYASAKNKISGTSKK